LSPGCIDLKSFSQRPQMSQFLCLKNIRIFLQTCRTVFKLSEQDLFDPADLFEVKEFVKVINTLCVLSCSPVAETKTPGFQTRSRSDYFSLQTLAGNTPDDEYDVVCNDNDHEIYEDLCALRRRTSFQEQTPVTKRDHCISELYETEKNYIDVLEMLIRCFIKRLNGRIPDFDIIFFGIEELHTIHVGFHSDLQKAYSNRHNTFSSNSSLTIADCFIKWKEKFLKYGEFCSNLPRVQLVIDKLIQNQSLNQIITECQNTANGGKFRLRDLLTVPMQRLLKYHLLLK
jgi:guanine nucleotide exchange factor VAV